MNSEIEDVDRVNEGILVSFTDGVVLFFDKDFLYAQSEKRVAPASLDS